MQQRHKTNIQKQNLFLSEQNLIEILIQEDKEWEKRLLWLTQGKGSETDKTRQNPRALEKYLEISGTAKRAMD